MSGLLFLTSDDFQIQRSTKGPVLCCNMQGFSLILFYSTQCSYCQTLIPTFKRLPGSVGNCQFGMINVSQNKHCILMSRQTIAPIKEVPYIILYVNGKPYMRYRGPHDPREIGRFIVEVAQKVQANQTFAKTDERIKHDPRSGIPAYTIGHPQRGSDDKVCYLDFDDAYATDRIGIKHESAIHDKKCYLEFVDAYGADRTGTQNSRPRQQLPSQAGMGTGGNHYNPNDPSGMGG